MNRMFKWQSLLMMSFFAGFLLLAAGSENEADVDTPAVPETPSTDPVAEVKVVPVEGGIQLDGISVDYSDCKVTTVAGEVEIVNNSFTVPAASNNCTQSFAINDGDNTYLITRTGATEGGKVDISVRSTALAVVSMHPLFAPVKASGLDNVNGIILASPYYAAYEKEVANVVAAKGNLFSTQNESLIKAVSNLMDNVCGKMVNDFTVEASHFPQITPDIPDDLRKKKKVISVADNSSTYPFCSEINGNVLTLTATGLTPSYYGTLAFGDVTENLALEAPAEYGGMDMFKEDGKVSLGSKLQYKFNAEGTYKFHLSRMTDKAKADFYNRVAKNLLAGLGVEINDEKVIDNIAGKIKEAITAIGSDVNDQTTSPTVWVSTAYKAVVSQLASGELTKYGVSEAVVGMGKQFLGMLDFYNKIKGAGDAATRLGLSLSAPEEVNFTIYYNGESAAPFTDVKLRAVSGNEQSGFANQKLLYPISVQVVEGAENPASSYYQVKFEVVEGEGFVSENLVKTNSSKKAETYWTLGKEGAQKVKATIVDIITGQEISEPVYFTATLGKADLTIRLDWGAESGNRDLDLHVIDPAGEEIYFDHPLAKSGGFLEKDATSSPGTEQIRWDTAPEGVYQIYVHYYPNRAEDKAFVNFTITVNSMGQTYQPIKGTVGYNQEVAVGCFTVGEAQAIVAATEQMKSKAQAAPKSIKAKK